MKKIKLKNGIILEWKSQGDLKPYKDIGKNNEDPCLVCPLINYCKSNNSFNCKEYGMFYGFFFNFEDAIEKEKLFI